VVWQGIVREGQLFKDLLLGPQADAQQHIFFAQRSCSRVPGIDPSLARPLRSVGVIGAGTMGGGVASTPLG
jgi:3-hydroxyacyl-CoA dehydrogenase